VGRKHGFDYDLIVIGSGTAGATSAAIAAKAGKSVAIVESGAFGGAAHHRNDVPTAALLYSAGLYDQSIQSGNIGLRTNSISYNYPALRAWQKTAIRRSGAANRSYYEGLGIDIISGLAHFLTPNEISVGYRHFSAKYFVVATGSNWRLPNVHGLSANGYQTPDTVIDGIRKSKHYLIIGGGETGVETAQILTSFGAKVTIAEAKSRLLPGYDPEAGQAIEKALSDKDVKVLADSRVLAIEGQDGSKRVLLARGGSKKHLMVDSIVVAAGCLPETDLGLDNAGVNYTKNGVKVNDYMQTNIRHIFAVGDVTGQHGLTHLGITEGRMAAHNIFNTNKIKVDHKSAPRIVLGYPNVAAAGLNESECRAKGLKIKKVVVGLSGAVRSSTANFSDGFVKLIADGNGRLVGATIVAPNAAEMIHELSLAITHQMSVTDLASSPRAFLSWSEAIGIAAQELTN
jgi:pyruvate/2-oxoglutarate dehydrogenase complex dihydrolipoamide dehydrogenase (E3) component